jgi:hypothetical protein
MIEIDIAQTLIHFPVQSGAIITLVGVTTLVAFHKLEKKIRYGN